MGDYRTGPVVVNAHTRDQTQAVADELAAIATEPPPDVEDVLLDAARKCASRGVDGASAAYAYVQAAAVVRDLKSSSLFAASLRSAQ